MDKDSCNKINSLAEIPLSIKYQDLIECFGYQIPEDDYDQDCINFHPETLKIDHEPIRLGTFLQL